MQSTSCQTVEGSTRRENPDSEICEGRPQEVGDVGHTSAVIHLVSETQASSVDLTPQTLKRRSRRRYVDDCRGGWLEPGLVHKAREEDMLYVKKHAVHEKVTMSQCWKKTEKNSIKTGWADTNKGTSECPTSLEGVKLVISEAASSNQKGDSTLSD